MKVYIAMIVGVILIALTVSVISAQPTVALNFQFNFDFTGNPNLKNFFLYTGGFSSNYTSKISLGTATNVTLGGFPKNTWVFCNVTANPTNGAESGFTTEKAIRTSPK